MPEKLVVIISGPPGAGKTSISAELATRFPKAVHLATDFYYHSIVTGYIFPWLAGAGPQNEVAVTAAARSIFPYASAGYAVFVDGVVLPWAFEIYSKQLLEDGITPKLVVLLPGLEETVRRGLARSTPDRLDASVYRQMYSEFEDAFKHGGADIIRDTGSVRDTADAVLRVCSFL